jgi:hypothetical protein
MAPVHRLMPRGAVKPADFDKIPFDAWLHLLQLSFSVLFDNRIGKFPIDRDKSSGYLEPSKDGFGYSRRLGVRETMC